MLLRSAPRAPHIYPLLAIVMTHWLIDISHKNVDSVKEGYYLIPSTVNTIGVLVSRPLAESEGKVTQVVMPIKSNLLLSITEKSFGIWLQAWLGPSTQKYMCLHLEPFFLVLVLISDNFLPWGIKMVTRKPHASREESFSSSVIPA